MDKSLSLIDLVLFGTASIVGAGGFNLVGNAVTSGGTYWPIPLFAAGAILLGSSYSYEQAYTLFKKNNAESEFIKEVFGETMSYISTACILIFNICSIAITLVLCSDILFDNLNYTNHVWLSILILAAMTAFSLQGIQINKQIVNVLSSILLCILSIIAIYGYSSIHELNEFTPSKTNIMMSFIYFFYILAGFDAIIKFTDETKEGVYVPSAFYISNILSLCIVFGLGLSFIQTASQHSIKNLNNSFISIVETVFGKGVHTFAKYSIGFYMLLTGFIVFLSNTRYLYELGSLHTSLSFLNKLNVNKVPIYATYITAIGVFIMILTNAIPLLVTGSDIGIIALLTIMNLAAITYTLKKTT